MDGRQLEGVTSESGDAPVDDGIRRVQDVWDAQARADPLWAVLSEPERAGRRWDLDGFLATGVDQVTAALARCEELGGTWPDRRLALDFGCGVGRLSQALGDHFDSVLGLDISPTMVAVAGRLNRHGARVRYRLNESTRLDGVATGSVSLVFSHITLQHVPSDMARSYLVEFLRVVEPGGIVIVQVPSHYADTYLAADRDDRPVAAEDRRVSVGLPVDPGPLPAGRTVELAVDVTNASGRTWMQTQVHPLHVGNHWLRGGSDVVAWDDGRARLPGRLAPGETVRIPLLVRAPAVAGDYLVSVDVVQEGVCWFAEGDPDPAGNRTLAVSVTDAPGAATPEGEADSRYFSTGSGASFDDLVSPVPLSPPEFEMNAVPRAEVEQLLAEAGATLLGTDEWVTEWHSFTYYVQAREEHGEAV